MKGVLANKDGINPKITKSSEVLGVLFKEAPRLVPPEFNPHCIETFIEIRNSQPSTSKTKPKKVKKSEKTKREKKTKTLKKVHSVL